MREKSPTSCMGLSSRFPRSVYVSVYTWACVCVRVCFQSCLCWFNYVHVSVCVLHGSVLAIPQVRVFLRIYTCMFSYMCVYVFVYVRVHFRIYVSLYVRACVFPSCLCWFNYVYMYVYVCVCVCIYVFVCSIKSVYLCHIYVNSYVCIFAHICVRMRAYVYAWQNLDILHGAVFTFPQSTYMYALYIHMHMHMHITGPRRGAICATRCWGGRLAADITCRKSHGLATR